MNFKPVFKSYITSSREMKLREERVPNAHLLSSNASRVSSKTHDKPALTLVIVYSFNSSSV